MIDRYTVRYDLGAAVIRAEDAMTVLAGRPRARTYSDDAELATAVEKWNGAAWNEPHDPDSYLELEHAAECAGAEVDFETRHDRLLIMADGGWRTVELPSPCSSVVREDLLLGAGLVARHDGGWVQLPIVHPRGIAVTDVVAHHDRLFGVTGFRARDQVCELVRDGTGVRCEPFGAGAGAAVPGRVERIAALSDGSLVVGGPDGLFVVSPDRPAPTTLLTLPGRYERVVCVAATPGDRILAATSAGNIVAGNRDRVAVVGTARGFDVSDRLSVVDFRGVVHVSTTWGVYRGDDDGFRSVGLPGPDPVHGLDHGTLQVVDDRLWLVGRHSIRWSRDGSRWTGVPFR